MNYLFKLAWKNILRAKRRTILTFIMLSFGIAFYIFFAGMMDGFDKKSFHNLINFETGHFKIRSNSFDDEHPFDLDNLLINTDHIESQIKKMEFITGFTKRIQFLSEIDNGIDSTRVITVGIDPVSDQKVFTLNQYIIKGKLKKGGAIIGVDLAKDMNLDIGQLIYISFRNKKGMFTSIGLVITGLVNTSNLRVNALTVFINFDEAIRIIGVNGVSEISLKTKDFKNISIYEKELRKKIKGVTIDNWKKLSGEFAALLQAKKKGGGFILFLIIIIALVGIVNTILMSVFEKKQEIGTLKALGMGDKEVRGIFIFEGFIIGILGSILGIILGALINLYFVTYGIDYTALIGDKRFTLNVLGVVHSTWDLSAFLIPVIIAILASVLASYFPSKRVLKMEAAECLRTVQ